MAFRPKMGNPTFHHLKSHADRRIKPSRCCCAPWLLSPPQDAGYDLIKIQAGETNDTKTTSVQYQ